MACSYLCAWESSAPPTQLLGFSPVSRPPWTPYEPYYSPRLNRPPALPPRLKEAEHALSEYVNRSKALVPALLIWRSYSLLPSKWVGSTDSFGSPCTFPPSSTQWWPLSAWSAWLPNGCITCLPHILHQVQLVPTQS